MGDRRSKEDYVQQVSQSIFVTNFPDHFSYRDLWRVCDEYGKVIDVYIPNRRSQAGKRYAFVRYVKIANIDRLVENLCTVWIGRLRLRANVVRFQRPPRNHTNNYQQMNGGLDLNFKKSKMDNGTQMRGNTYVSVVKNGTPQSVFKEDTQPALVLDSECILQRDYSCSLMGKVKDFGSISNMYVILANEGFENLKLRYVGGFWLLIEFQSSITKEQFSNHMGVKSWFSNLEQATNKFYVDERVTWVDIDGIPLHAWTQATFARIASKWGMLLYAEDNDETCLHRKRLCVKLKSKDNIFGSFKIIVQGEVYWVRAKEVTGWIPKFNEEEKESYVSDEDVRGERLNEVNEEADCDEEVVSESSFVNAEVNAKQDEDVVNHADSAHIEYEDPFNIYGILNKQKEENNGVDQSEGSLKFPPDFTPSKDVDVHDNTMDGSVNGNKQNDKNGPVSTTKSQDNLDGSRCSGIRSS
ncbi:hypothetical protein CTI12_AA337550 [Artemisia annua]|uniref:RRM domain-containing protein n=1 Tax=Artemisia annua TaxID=35608 RepID=A0A2U1MV34_ARTAN|nr:hypothetical protein CTI12_AA337550 [Artemisia annua]